MLTWRVTVWAGSGVAVAVPMPLRTLEFSIRLPKGKSLIPMGIMSGDTSRLRGLDAAVIHQPWEASPLDLKKAGVELGRAYPLPIVPHAEGYSVL